MLSFLGKRHNVSQNTPYFLYIVACFFRVFTLKKIKQKAIQADLCDTKTPFFYLQRSRQAGICSTKRSFDRTNHAKRLGALLLAFFAPPVRLYRTQTQGEEFTGAGDFSLPHNYTGSACVYVRYMNCFVLFLFWLFERTILEKLCSEYTITFFVIVCRQVRTYRTHFDGQ